MIEQHLVPCSEVAAWLRARGFYEFPGMAWARAQAYGTVTAVITDYDRKHDLIVLCSTPGERERLLHV